MTLIEHDAGAVLMAGFAAASAPPRLLRALRRQHLGGVILFERNVGTMGELAELNRTLIAAAGDLPPLLGVDQEGGRVARLGEPVLQLPPMRVLGEIDDARLTADAARLLGGQLARLGFNLDFAPVLDIDSNPANPVIGDRSFGSSAERVIRHGRAFTGGLRDAGLIACGKHFPGHGDTAVDSHLALPRVEHDLERLTRVELAPFARLAGELDSIMTAHIVFDALDAERPATLSGAVLGDLLRGQLGFRGVVVSDDLDMAAIASSRDVADAACQAIAAGCDVVLVCQRDEGAYEAHAELVRRARADTGFRARLAEAASRARRLRRRYPAQVAIGDDADEQLRALDHTGVAARLRTGHGKRA